MKLSLIVAMADNRVIGRDNQLPWHLPDDLKRFKQITMGHPVIMGRKTFESIGRPLPKRHNVILSRQSSFHAEGVTVLKDPREVIEIFKAEEEVFVIGGAEIYQLFLKDADLLYLTLVHESVSGDVLFPEYDPTEFNEVSRETVEKPIPHSFVVLERVQKQ